MIFTKRHSVRQIKTHFKLPVYESEKVLKCVTFYLYIKAIEGDFANTGYFYHFLVAVNLASVQFHRLSNITLVYA